MAIVSPFAAQQRAIKRIEKREQRADLEIQKRDQRRFDEKIRQAGVDRRRNEEIRRKAGLAEQDAQMRKDLIMTLARGKGQGMFAAKLPRINKFILHAGTEDKDPATGKIVRTNELGFDPQIDPGHIEKLRTLSSLVRDNQAARALAFHRTGKLPPKRDEKVLSDLGSDDFPAFSRQEHKRQAMAAPIFEADPEAEVGPIEAGGMPVGAAGAAPTAQQFPLAPGDIDLTQLLQTGLIGPPTDPEQFRPGFEQGFQGPDVPAAPIENIHELIQSGIIPGTKAQQPQRNPTQEKIDAFVSTMAAMGHDVTPEMIQRMVGAAEKGPDLLKQTMIDFFRERSGLAPLGTSTAQAGEPPKKTAKKKGAKAGRPQITKRFIDDAKRQFLAANPDRTIENVVIRGDQVILIDDEGFENLASPQQRS